MKGFAGVLAVLLLWSCASLAQTAPARQTAPDPQTVAEASTPETTSQPAAASAPAVAGVAFGPGVKLFVEPMDGFDELLAEAIVKKKVPVVLVHDRAQADFILAGEAHVKKPGWLKGNFVYLHGSANISIENARTGDPVFAYKSNRVDANLVDGEVYKIWAGGCANQLKKALKKR